MTNFRVFKSYFLSLFFLIINFIAIEYRAFCANVSVMFRDVNDVTKACFEIDAMETAKKYNSAWKRTNG